MPLLGQLILTRLAPGFKLLNQGWERTSSYHNNRIDQNHRGIKRLVKTMMGCQTIDGAIKLWLVSNCIACSENTSTLKRANKGFLNHFKV